MANKGPWVFFGYRVQIYTRQVFRRFEKSIVMMPKNTQAMHIVICHYTIVRKWILEKKNRTRTPEKRIGRIHIYLSVSNAPDIGVAGRKKEKSCQITKEAGQAARTLTNESYDAASGKGQSYSHSQLTWILCEVCYEKKVSCQVHCRVSLRG